MLLGTEGRRGWDGRWLGMAVSVSALVVSAAWFLPRQAFWLDEATQLSGESLGPWAVTRWLAGMDANGFDQFPDRTPPLSYWLGWAWACLFGPGEHPARWLGVFYVAAATALVYEGARRAFGVRSAWVAGLSFALSPAVIIAAVVIRPYPLFLLEAAAAAFFLVRLLEANGSPRAGDVAGLAVALAAGIGTHFFGLVLAASVWSALAIAALRSGAPRAPVVVVAGIVALAAVGIAPFVAHALTLAQTDVPGHRFADRWRGALRLLGSLDGHAALAIHRGAAIGSRVATLTLALLATLGIGLTHRTRPVLGLVLVLGLGCAGAAKLLLQGFDAATPSYSIWVRPALCLWLSAGVASTCRPARWLAVAASVVLVAVELVGAAEFGRHGDYLAQGPHRPIARVIRDLGPRRVAVVYDDPSPGLVFDYCPLRFDFGTDLAHYQVLAPGPAAAPLVRPFALKSPPVPGPGNLLPVDQLAHPYLVVIRSWVTPPRDLIEQIRNGDRPAPAAPIARALRASEHWRLVSERVVVAFRSARVSVFERRHDE